MPDTNTLTPGNQTSEGKISLYVTAIAGLLAAALPAVAAMLVQLGTVPGDSPTVVVLGVVAAVAAAVAGKTATSYATGRSDLKAAIATAGAEAAKAAAVALAARPGAPQDPSQPSAGG